MISLTEAFLSHGAKAYPCGLKVKESKKMLNELPEFRNIDFVATRTALRARLAKGTKAPAKTKDGGRG